MKICKNCNASNIDSVMFCLTCGKTDLVVLSNKFPFESQQEFEESEQRRKEKLQTNE